MRLQRLREAIFKERLDGFLITAPINRRYVSGFTGTAGVLLITAQDAYIITDFRYIEQAKREAPDFQGVRHGPSLVETLAEVVFDKGLKRVGFESEAVSFKEYEDLSRHLNSITLVPTRGIVEEMRKIKDRDEIEKIRMAAQIADEAFSRVLEFIEPGVREKDIATELEYLIRRLGGKGASFDLIVASGERGALPHGTASEKVVEEGDLVTIDFGALFEGYCSDCTRTIAIGGISDKGREIYEVVRDAQLAGVEAARAGMSCKALDELVRSIIAERGYGEFFGHGLGHGVGMNVHELPSLSQRGEDTLQAGMVVTIEPGIYLPGWGGIRIEDLVVICEEGIEILTGTSKDLMILD